MTAKFTFRETLDAAALVEWFIIAILQLPAAVAVTAADKLALPSCKDTITTSLIPMLLFVKVKLLIELMP